MPQNHLLTSNFRVAFEEYFNPDQQKTAVETLRIHIVHVRDGSEEQQRQLGVLRTHDTTPERIETRLASYLNKCYWQLAQFLRYSVPCRVSEAEPFLREVMRYARATESKRDVAPEIYLAVAIHNVPEKCQEALSIFDSAFQHVDEHGAPALGPRSELWARASWARLLRRMDRVHEAEAQEQAIVDWIVAHPLVLPPAKLKALVGDETDSGVLNNILEHPDVQSAIESARQKK